MAKLTIHADWNAEAAVWSPRSADLPGLAIEAPMLDALLNRLRTTVCPLLPRMETCTGAAPTSYSCRFCCRSRRRARPAQYWNQDRS